MRFSLSLKVFLLFSSLTLMTLALGVTAFYSLKTGRTNYARVMELKDFILHLERLDAMTARVPVEYKLSIKQDILTEIEVVEKQINTIADFGFAGAPETAGRFAALPQAIQSFHQDLLDLLDQYTRHKQLISLSRQYFTAVEQHLQTLPGVNAGEFYRTAKTLWMSRIEASHPLDLVQYAQLKEIQEEIHSITKDPFVNQLLQALVQSIEDDLLLSFAIKNREELVKNSSGRFFELANEGIRTIQKKDKARQARSSIVFLSGSILAVCFNLGLWFLTSAYFRRFLTSQKAAIQAIETDDFEYDFPPPSTDEIGDLSLAMKALARNLARSRERYLNFFNQAGDAVFIFGADGRVIDANEKACQSLGYQRPEMLKMTVAQIDEDFVKDNPIGQIMDRLARQKSVTIHRNYLKKNKAPYPAELTIAVMYTDMYDRLEGRISIPEKKLYTVFARDISGRKAAEKALRDSETKYRSMMETMPDPVYICSPDFKVAYMNPAMIQRTGTDGTGQHCFTAIHGLNDFCPWCRWKDEDGGFSRHIMDIVSPIDNRSFHVSSSPIAQPDGTVFKLSIYRDVTELKRLESQLMQAQKMESIGTLAGGIAHDFNNILFPIMGYTEMLFQDIPRDSPLRKSLDKIYSGAMRAKELVRQILTFSRQEKGEIRLMEIQPVIKEALKLLRASIPATIEMKTRIPSHSPKVKADPVQIHQIIMNLATNAYHSMEETGGQMTISLATETVEGNDPMLAAIPAGTYNCLRVSDTGTGMDEGILEKIFDPYFTTKEQGKGTGMGLAVVHGIVTRMGGGITVASKKQEGTCFKVYFPLADPMDESLENALDQPPGSLSEDTLPKGSGHILVVDDEPDIAAIEKLMLEKLGYRVTATTGSPEALEFFKNRPQDIDLVVTDLTMPKMSGEALFKKMRQIRSDIPILVCTGFSDREMDLSLESGLYMKLAKPLSIKDLADSVHQLLTVGSLQSDLGKKVHTTM